FLPVFLISKFVKSKMTAPLVSAQSVLKISPDFAAQVITPDKWSRVAVFSPTRTLSLMNTAMKYRAGNIGRQVLAALVAGIILPVAVRAATITHTVTAEADAYVRSSAEKKSFGFEHMVELSLSGSGATEGYVQFPLPQHAAYADKVVLRIFAQLAEPGA